MISKPRSMKKPLLISATAFLTFYPLCLAHAATSSFGEPLSQHQSKTTLKTLQHSQLQTSLNQSLRSSNPLSISVSLDSLKSTLSTYKEQLRLLAPNVSNKARLQPLESAISNLEAQIQRATALQSANATAQSTLSKATTDYAKAQEDLQKATTLYTQHQTANQEATALYNQAIATAEVARTALTDAQTAASQAAQNLAQATVQLQTANITLTSKLTALQEAGNSASTATEALAQAQQNYNQAELNYFIKSGNKSAASQTFNEAVQRLKAAQDNYNTNLIPDPNWTAPTYQKEHTRQVENTRTVEVRTLVPTTTTTLQEQVIPNLLFNSDFSRGNEGWSGLSVGWQNSQPGFFNGNIAFSYMNQTVSQGLYSGPFQNSTLTLSADWFNDDSNRNITDSYSMTVTARDINQNPVGSATYTSTGRHNWETKSVTLTPTGPVSYITVEFSGIDNGYWAGNYGPRLKNPSLEVKHGEMVTQTTYEEVITYEEEIYYTTETYYTTELVQPQTGLTARVYNNLPTSNPQRSDTAYNLCKTTTLTSINHQWGGGDILGCGSDRVMIHYTGYLTPDRDITSLQNSADDGFFMSLDGVTVINDWRLKGCSGSWYPVALEAGKTYEIDAWFFEWGGGACSILNYQSGGTQSVVPESWYTNAISAPLIKNPALLPELEAATEVKNSAEAALEAASFDEAAALEALNEASSKVASDRSTLTSATASLAEAQLEYNSALITQQSAAEDYASTQRLDNEAQAANQAALEKEAGAAEQLLTATSNLETSNQNLTTSDQRVKEATETLSTSETALTTATDVATSTTSNLTTTISEAEDTATTTQTLLSNTKPDPEPEPEPEPEQGSPEIPAVIENLMEVNLEQVDPTELTEAQAEQLVEAALVAFETAVEGSPEYEQALDALYLAAEQDDLVLSEELAAIPGLAGAVEVLNFLGNAGADMSPKVREESEKVVVATVIAAGAAIQAATGAATSAAVSASAPTGSSGSRRVGK